MIDYQTYFEPAREYRRNLVEDHHGHFLQRLEALQSGGSPGSPAKKSPDEPTAAKTRHWPRASEPQVNPAADRRQRRNAD
jgi:hypothetical protein